MINITTTTELTQYGEDDSGAVQLTCEFKKGQMLTAGGSLLRILFISESFVIQIEDVHTREIRSVQLSALKKAIDQGHVTVKSDEIEVQAVNLQKRTPGLYSEWIEEIPSFMRSEAGTKVMLMKIEWIKRLKRHGVTSYRPSDYLSMKLREVEKLSDENCPFSMHTIYKSWLRLQRSQGDARSLFPRFDQRGGAGQTRLGSEVEGIISRVLSNLEKPGSHKLHATKLHDEVRAAVMSANISREPKEELHVPSLPTITRRFKDHFGAYEIAKRNFGKARADRIYRESAVRVHAERCLDVVMYDDTDTCVFMIDERTGLPWGRGWLTVGVDEASRSVTGLSMSHHPRSTISAYEAVVHSLKEKNRTDIDFERCKSNWHAYGNQGLIVLDNATYNTSADFQACLIDLGIEYEYARPHHPTNKTCVEFFHNRMKQEFCRNLPGWSGPKEDRELLDHGLATAIFSLSDFRKNLFRWIVDDYSNSPMGGLGFQSKSPRQIWDETFAFHAPYMPQRWPSEELVSTISTTLKFRDSGGLLRLGLRYKSEALEKLRLRHGSKAKMNVRYRADNLAFIYVEDPESKHYLKVPCAEDSRVYEGLSNYQWRLVLKQARQLTQKNFAIQHAVDARQKLREETASLRFSKKVLERKRSLQFADVQIEHRSDEQVISQKKEEKIVIVSALESLIASLDEDFPDTSPEMSAVFFSDHS
jgi:putative transposase